MKKMLTFGLSVIVVLLCTACDFNVGFNTVTISGREKTETTTANTDGGTYGIKFDNLQFTQSNVTINIVPITSEEKARIEVTYTEALDNYGFYVNISGRNILVGTTEQNTQFDIDKFDMTIYAVFNEVDMSGYGYTTLINATGITPNLSISARGSVNCKVSALEATNLTINTSGGADVTLAGRVTNARINASGSSDIYAINLICGNIVSTGNINIDISGSSSVITKLEASSLSANASGSSYITLSGTVNNASTVKATGSSNINAKYLICNSANVNASGASDILISVRNTLRAKASGGSDIQYWGPKATEDSSGSSSINQISFFIP